MKGFAWRRWVFAAVPLLAVIEIVLHVRQSTGAPKDEAWLAARAVVRELTKPEDLVIIAPRWEEPIARMNFGDELMTLERVARADDDRFPRAIEVSLRGARAPEVRAWREESRRDVGDFTVRVLANPAHRPVKDDLVSRVGAPGPKGMRVFRVDQGGETECPFTQGAPDTGGIGHGPAVPAGRYACPGGGLASLTVLADLEYRPRRCIYAPPTGAPVVLRIKFPQVTFGSSLAGHHGIYVEAERVPGGVPVTLSFKAEGQPVGKAVHHDMMGWRAFEHLTPPELAGKEGELVAEISAQNGQRRSYCFEATTR